MDVTNSSRHAPARPLHRRVAGACAAAIACAVILILLSGYLAIYAALDGQSLSLDLWLHRTPRLVCVMARLCSA